MRRVRLTIAGSEPLKTLIISANRYRNPMAVMPVGACVVADATAGAGHSVQMLDLMFSRNPLNDVRRTLRTFGPDVVGISVRNIDNNDVCSPEKLCGEIQPLVATIHAHGCKHVVLGGAALGVMPEALLRETGASIAVLGDGEFVFPKLLTALENGRGPSEVPGVAWIEDGEFKFNAGFNSSILKGACAPAYDQWLNVGAYKRMMCSAAVQTKRGCPFSCVYCTYGIAEGSQQRLCSPESVVDGIRRLARSGISDIEFVDSVFNHPHDHALAVCDAMAGADLGVRSMSMEMNPRFVDSALLAAMKRAGFVGMGVTVDSASDSVLKGLSKNFTSDDVWRCADTVRHGQIPCVWIFLLGGPGETDSTVSETLRFAGEQMNAGDVAFFNVGLRVYPGTRLDRIARDEGVLHAPPEEMLSPVFYVSPQVKLERIEEQLDAFVARHLSALGPRTISLPFLPLLYRIGHRLGMRPPLWRHTARTRRMLQWIGVRT